MVESLTPDNFEKFRAWEKMGKIFIFTGLFAGAIRKDPTPNDQGRPASIGKHPVAKASCQKDCSH